MFTIVDIKAKRSVVRALMVALALGAAVTERVVMADVTPPGDLFSVNTHKVHINCTGSGSPAVVLVSGLGGSSLEWTQVQRRLSRYTRVCSYDRPGYGWSEMSTAPRNARTMARELNELLAVSGEAGPYLLVGHSLGGHIIRLFANEYPSKVAGLVLVDAAHEDMFSLLGKYKGRQNMMNHNRSLAGSVEGSGLPDNFPQELKSLAIKQMSQFQTRFAVASEMRQFRQSADEVRHIGSLAAMPITIVSRDSRILAGEGRNGLMARKWAGLQRELHKRLSNSEHVIAQNSGHYPHLDRPELVSLAILNMVGKPERELLSKL